MAYPGYGGGFGNFGNPLGQPGYPGHPAYPGSISTGDPMWKCFLAIAGQDGEVDAEELQKCLTQSGISGTYSPFSLETCRIMIAMLDQNFITVDKDGSGSVEHHELNQAIAAMGYRLSPQTVTTIVKRYSKNGRIFFDDYVACCVKLRALTDFFRRRDHLQQGVVSFVYDDVSILYHTFDVYTVFYVCS
ncbi:grancalcin isoform X3 [Bos javanicus]|uniref:grancalcin isoform X3 n=1 Tax=Bos javanicus TaxID=9906 RepID=UPI002AA8B642|nr:grancalcin isoform X3 [Bos javanicus]